MENSNNSENGQGLDFWEEQVLLLSNSMEGLRTAYAVMADMHKHALEQVSALSPIREEV
nr:MAG: hypothetical protein [Microvirus sp.]